MFVQCPICLPSYICIKVSVSCALSHRHYRWGLASHKSFCRTRDTVSNTFKNPDRSFLLIPPQFGSALPHSCNFIYHYTCCMPLPLAHLFFHPFTSLVSSMPFKMDFIYDSIQLSIAFKCKYYWSMNYVPETVPGAGDITVSTVREAPAFLELRVQKPERHWWNYHTHN